MPPPSQLATVYCVDESIAIRASGDYATLVPEWQKLAYGTDGAFASGDLWTLTSTSTDFAARGVAANHVVLLTLPKTRYKGGGELFAVESVATTSCTLRRLGQDASVGEPPAPTGGLTAVEFRVLTLYPQIEEASFDLNRRFNIDLNVANRDPASLYDQRDLRQACILTVLKARYLAETRTDRGDFRMKLAAIEQELSQVMDRINIRWGSAGDDVRSTTWMSTRIVR